MTNAGLVKKISEVNILVGPIIKELLTRDVEKQNAELAFYQCNMGGKRLRPTLVVICGQIFGADIKDLIYPAAAIEILHNATLITDDIIDHSTTRRDQPTCWSKFGKSIAECEVLVYVASAFAGLSHTQNSSKLIDLYGRTLKIVIDGEIKDILFERSGRQDENYVVQNRYKTITKNDYFEMIGQKTAVLLQASCEAGAICAGAGDEEVKLVGNVGYNLGIAFQIQDDILDIFGDEKEFGKKIGKDIIEKKMGNLLILLAIEQLEPAEKAIVVGLLEGEKGISDDDVVTVKSLIGKTDAKKVALDLAQSHIKIAYESLKTLPDNIYRQELESAIEYVVGRKK